MLELFAIFLLGRRIKAIVNEKGLNATRYILIMLGLWVSFEFTGALIFVLFFGENLLVYLFALCWAALGGYFGYYIAINAQPIKDSH